MTNLTSTKPTVSKYQWSWQEQSLTIAYETDGIGAQVLLLPSFSTVSSRTELSELASYLRSNFQVTIIDFPGLERDLVQQPL